MWNKTVSMPIANSIFVSTVGWVWIDHMFMLSGTPKHLYVAYINKRFVLITANNYTFFLQYAAFSHDHSNDMNIDR